VGSGVASVEREVWHIDATKFQTQLGELATTVAYKVQREGGPSVGRMAAEDIYVLVRQAQRTYDLFFYLNAEEHRREPFWRPYYTFAALPAVRSMIDCLYNITAMLEDPISRSAEFRRSGYRMALESIEEDELKYSGSSDPRWSEWFRRRREALDLGMRRDGFKMGEVLAQKRWPTLGRYLQPRKGVPLTDHQLFLRDLTFGYWREYSEYSHGTFQGLMRTALPYLEHDLPIEDRSKLEERSLLLIFDHMARAAAILLCILTELQARFRFDGARINQRLHQVWNVLVVAPEVKDLFDSRYARLMKDKGITP
jgi:hypothetical protein